jgi:hypothetical protein
MKRIIFLAMGLVFFGFNSKAQKFPKVSCTTLLGEAMFAEVDTTKPRGVSDNYRTWDNGSVIRIKFMPGGSKNLRDRVIQNAKEWEKYANLKFNFVADTASNTQLRIKLGKGSGHNSAVGTEANFRSQNMQTMNFDTLYFADFDYYLAKLKRKGVNPPYDLSQLMDEMKMDPFHWSVPELRRVVMHEFGHAIGLLHEQSYPGAVNWKKTDSIYNYYLESQGWDKDKVDFNVFEVSNQFYTNGTSYDPKSIMHYSIQPWETNDGYAIKDNYELSAGDKMLIAALYPKNQQVSNLAVPKVNITNFTKLSVVSNAIRGGLVIQPSFDLKTNSKLGEVYFVARLADEDGYYVRTSSLFYNWGGTVATYLKMNLLPNSKVSYNKTAKKNLELFLPFDQIPEMNGKKVVIEFAVYLDDVKNNQMDKLMYFSTTNPLSITR